MELFRVIGIALITVVLALILKQYRREYAIVVTIAGVAVLLFSILDMLQPAVAEIHDWFDASGLESGNLAILLKSMGICFLTQFASDTCKDAGESALASKVELAGKISVVVMALPLFRSAAETALSLTGGEI